MTELGRFFDTVSYGEADQAEVQNRFRREGVLFEVDNKLAVGAPGSMFVSVGTGEAMVEGFWYKNTAALNLAVASNTSGSTRVDLVVLRLNRVANTLVAAIVMGTPGAGTPALTQVVGGTWEFPLASITVPTATTSAITAGMLADLRTYSVQAKYAQEIADGIVGYSHLVNGAVTNLLLNYRAATDLYSGGSIPALTITNLIAAQNFTVSVGCTALRLSVEI
jgi:hypothetical protein